MKCAVEFEPTVAVAAGQLPQIQEGNCSCFRKTLNLLPGPRRRSVYLISNVQNCSVEEKRTSRQVSFKL